MSLSERGNVFHNIHQALYEFLGKIISMTRAEYLERVLDWHDDFRADLDGIRNATHFYDFQGKINIRKKEDYGDAQINKMITVSLRYMYSGTGMLIFEKHFPQDGSCPDGLYMIDLISACNGVGFILKARSYYDDARFNDYGSIQKAVNRLKENFRDLPQAAYVPLSEYIDSMDIHLNNNITRETYNFLANAFGVFGKLLFVAYYSFNKHYLCLPDDKTADNVYMAFKKDIESAKRFSILNRTNEAKRIRIVCYTATSFLSSDRVGEVYDFNWHTAFMNLLQSIPIDLVLVPPDSKNFADIINYHLRPRMSSDKVEDRTRPFQLNYKKLKRIMDDICDGEIRNTDLNVYFAKCPLTNAYFQCIFDDDSMRDTIKCDIYTPLFSTYEKGADGIFIPDEQLADDNRPSFVVKPDNKLYTFFSKNIDDIIQDSDDIIINSKYVNDDCQKRIESFASGEYELTFDEKDIKDSLL